MLTAYGTSIVDLRLTRAEHVRDGLVKSIKHNGGLIEAILVRKGVVLEGNSRLAAYRILEGQ
jgi:hypothetical protein